MKISFDLEKEKTLTIRQLIKLMLTCLIVGAISALISFVLGIFIVGLAAMLLLFPTLMKLTEKKHETS